MSDRSPPSRPEDIPPGYENLPPVELEDVEDAVLKVNDTSQAVLRELRSIRDQALLWIAVFLGVVIMIVYLIAANTSYSSCVTHAIAASDDPSTVESDVGDCSQWNPLPQ